MDRKDLFGMNPNLISVLLNLFVGIAKVIGLEFLNRTVRYGFTGLRIRP